MKKKMITVRACLGTCAALGWWGLLYPELVLTPDTVRVYEQNEEQEFIPVPLEWSFECNLYKELLSADFEQITFRSRLFEDISLFWEAFQNGNQ